MKVLLFNAKGSFDHSVERTLVRFGYSVTCFDQGSDDAPSLAIGDADIIVVDFEPMGQAPVAALRRLRDLAPMGIILALTWRNHAHERVRALDAGADDCMSRPFSSIELHARIKALVRSRRGDVVRLGQLVWNGLDRQGEVNFQRLSLSRCETALMEALLRSPCEIVPMHVLVRQIEAHDGSTAYNRLYVYISRLRKKLTASDLRIRSVSGLGYAINVVGERLPETSE